MPSKYQPDYLLHDAEYQRRRAQGYPGWAPADALAAYLDLLAGIFSQAHFPKTGRLLELGCGAGDWSLWAAAQGYEVTGMDISPTAIQWATEKSRHRELSARFQVGNVLDLGRYASASFDIVLDGHCFHCIVGDDRPRFLREAHRVLKSGGIFHVNTMCGDPGCGEHWRQFDQESRSLLRAGTASRHIGLPVEIEREVSSAGFTVASRKLLPRRNDREFDLLLLDAVKT